MPYASAKNANRAAHWERGFQWLEKKNVSPEIFFLNKKKTKYLQSLPLSVEQRLAQGLVLRDGLEDLPVARHVPDRPLP